MNLPKSRIKNLVIEVGAAGSYTHLKFRLDLFREKIREPTIRAISDAKGEHYLQLQCEPLQPYLIMGL